MPDSDMAATDSQYSPLKTTTVPPKKLAGYLAALVNRKDFEYLVERPTPDSASDWIMNVSILRRHAYALAETAAMIDFPRDTIPAIRAEVTYAGTRGNVSAYEFKVLAPAAECRPGERAHSLWFGYHLNLARYTNHLALTHPSSKRVGDFLAETAAMATSLFNDRQYLDFVYLIANSPDSGIPVEDLVRTKKALSVERVYRALQWEGDLKALSLFRRDTLRLPKQYLDGTAIENRSGDRRREWDDGVGIAVTDKRWRTSDNPYGYIRTVARRIIGNAVREDADTNVWISARKYDVTLVSLSWFRRDGKYIGYRESVVDKDGEVATIDLAAAYSAGGFDAEMIACVEARLAGLTWKEIPQFDAARKRIERAKEKVRHLWNIAALPEAGLDLQPPTYYRQRFYPSPLWVYTHIFDDGSGRMIGAEGYRQSAALWRCGALSDRIPARCHYSAAPLPMMFWSHLSNDTLILRYGVATLRVPSRKRRKMTSGSALKTLGVLSATDIAFGYWRGHIAPDKAGFKDRQPICVNSEQPSQTGELLTPDLTVTYDDLCGIRREVLALGGTDPVPIMKTGSYNRTSIYYYSLMRSKDLQIGTRSGVEGAAAKERIAKIMARLGFEDVAAYDKSLTFDRRDSPHHKNNLFRNVQKKANRHT